MVVSAITISIQEPRAASLSIQQHAVGCSAIFDVFTNGLYRWLEEYDISYYAPTTLLIFFRTRARLHALEALPIRSCKFLSLRSQCAPYNRTIVGNPLGVRCVENLYPEGSSSAMQLCMPTTCRHIYRVYPLGNAQLLLVQGSVIDACIELRTVHVHCIAAKYSWLYYKYIATVMFA